MSDLQALAIFTILILGMLALDLLVFHRRAQAVSFSAAAAWTSVWIMLSLAGVAGLYFWRGPEPALEFLTAYILEKSLATDNIFIFASIFGAWEVAARYQHKVLLWGVLGALATRGVLILAGVALIIRFQWLLYLLGVFLIFTGAKTALKKREGVAAQQSTALRWARRIFPLTDHMEGESFFIRRNGRLLATPLFLVLVVIEVADVLLALDSISAIFAVTEDPFIIYTSNILAILGLRAMYTLLAGALRKIRYLRQALSLVLIFVGTKMVAAHFHKVSTLFSLAVICAILVSAVLLSLRRPGRNTAM